MADRPRTESARQRRLAAALRDNLKRRKAQARGRKSGNRSPGTAGEDSVKPHDSAGIAEHK
jgi:hypothetical protein